MSHPDDQCTKCGGRGHEREDCKWPDCTDCASAMLKAAWGGFRSSCLGCAARAIAHGMLYFEAAKRDAMTPTYKAALQSTFGDGWRAGHDQVKAWARKLEAAAC